MRVGGLHLEHANCSSHWADIFFFLEIGKCSHMTPLFLIFSFSQERKALCLKLGTQRADQYVKVVTCLVSLRSAALVCYFPREDSWPDRLHRPTNPMMASCPRDGEAMYVIVRLCRQQMVLYHRPADEFLSTHNVFTSAIIQHAKQISSKAETR